MINGNLQTYDDSYIELKDYAKNMYLLKLSVEERYAIKEYTTYSHANINSCLRKNLKSDDKITIKLLDSAIKKFDFNKGITVYRDLSFYDKGEQKKFIKQIDKGYIFDKGFISTSLVKGAFNGDIFDFRLQIDVPAQYDGAYIKYLSYHRSEEEYLIGRNTKIEILDCERRQVDDKIKFYILTKIK